MLLADCARWSGSGNYWSQVDNERCLLSTQKDNRSIRKCAANVTKQLSDSRHVSKHSIKCNNMSK
jgi:hypothetical protein